MRHRMRHPIVTAVLTLLPFVHIPAQATAPTPATQFSPAEYAARRDSLAARIDSGVVVALGGRTPVADFGPFYQLPAFRYLTGFEEADAAFVMVARRGRGTSTLFVTQMEPRRALYYGQRPDTATIQRTMGIAARSASALASVLDSLAGMGLPIYELRDFEAADFARADSLTRGGQLMRSLAARRPGLVMRDAHTIVDELRARKSPAEQALIRKAAEISAEGHRALMRGAEPGMHEYDLQAIAEYAFRRQGAERPAYGSIVGAGPNSLLLHYMKNRREVKAGDVVVIDAGAEYGGYTADVTRTIPMSGTFTPAQRAIYQLVRDAQAAAERNSRPGMSAPAAEDSSYEVRARGLARLGLIESADAMFDPPWAADCQRTPRQCRQATLFTIHGISHGIGLAVHDPAQFYTGDRTFKSGDAFTIEPGVYVSARLLDLLADTPKNRAFAAKARPAVGRYEGVGVRIEDDYIVTERGLEWITRGAPREIAEIEALMAKRAPPPVPDEGGQR
ncbi:MAG: aminopeptidase P N-terminal domain-containing protein [Gemmatimonadaceae bacterium]